MSNTNFLEKKSRTFYRLPYPYIFEFVDLSLVKLNKLDNLVKKYR